MRLAREMRLTLDGPPPTVGGSRRSNRSCITTVLNPGATAGQIVSEVRVAMLSWYAAPPMSPTQRKGCAVRKRRLFLSELSAIADLFPQ